MCPCKAVRLRRLFFSCPYRVLTTLVRPVSFYESWKEGGEEEKEKNLGGKEGGRESCVFIHMWGFTLCSWTDYCYKTKHRGGKKGGQREREREIEWEGEKTE